ncbi:anti-sigma factor [Acidicapsa acidisoli]|uniref:anti-sigma factor n=1 Tax=Acidicapsa acidisoli TaxID=1615681 RepID=UPI0021DFC87A|nr:hypothetical protein [Acidicapsa acidisoli]
MNPQWHDEFVALCALFPSGELTEEEWALLQVHLAYCDSCRVVFEQYKQLSSDVVPVLAASAYSEIEDKSESLPFSLAAAEKKLMNQLDSLPAKEQSPVRRKIFTLPLLGLIAACAVGLASFVGFYWMHPKTENASRQETVKNPEHPAQPTASTPTETDLQPKLELALKEVATLRQQVSVAEGRYRQSNATVASMERQLESEQAEQKKISDQRDALSQQLSVAQSEAQSLRDKSDQASSQTEQQMTRTVALETRIHDLTSSLNEKDRMLELDKEFLAHDREIRDLIAARNLYMVDIYDVGQNGKTKPPVGRIFYTKDRSLVFYGYDLDKEAGLKQSVAFQAWGSGDDKQNVSLGLFYQDDTHKRWVLRFNDTKTLARLNMVFVTAEPQGGSTKPTGKPLLLAYLQVQPNHP